MTRIYLDHNATTPPSAGVIDRMAAVFREEFGNPSSVHHFGQRAKAVLDEARSQVATASTWWRSGARRGARRASSARAGSRWRSSRQAYQARAMAPVIHAQAAGQRDLTADAIRRVQ